jgi:hypothetical protein
MDLSKILSIAGKSGLFRVVSQAKNAVIVESLIDNKRFPAFGHEKISSLEEISVFTYGDDMPLKAVFKALFEKLEGKPAMDHKSDNAALKQFFIGIVPEYDQERVYVSDIRKMINWYNLLLQHQLLDFTEEKAEESTAETTTDATTADQEQTSEEQPTGDPKTEDKAM